MLRREPEGEKIESLNNREFREPLQQIARGEVPEKQRRPPIRAAAIRPLVRHHPVSCAPPQALNTVRAASAPHLYMRIAEIAVFLAATRHEPAVSEAAFTPPHRFMCVFRHSLQQVEASRRHPYRNE
jgi:hypothetical protein